jgi:PIN domain nuclease of toxin-antitoxin system
VRLLLDTHVMLWWVTGDRRLTKTGRGVIGSEGNDVLVSAASFWEVAIKQSLGRIDVDLEELREALREDGFREMVIEIPHALQLSKLPNRHRDPFDRLLIAQSMVDGCRLMTADETVLAYADIPGFEPLRA